MIFVWAYWQTADYSVNKWFHWRERLFAKRIWAVNQQDNICSLRGWKKPRELKLVHNLNTYSDNKKIWSRVFFCNKTIKIQNDINSHSLPPQNFGESPKRCWHPVVSTVTRKALGWTLFLLDQEEEGAHLDLQILWWPLGGEAIWYMITVNSRIRENQPSFLLYQQKNLYMAVKSLMANFFKNWVFYTYSSNKGSSRTHEKLYGFTIEFPVIPRATHCHIWQVLLVNIQGCIFLKTVLWFCKHTLQSSCQ